MVKSPTLTIVIPVYNTGKAVSKIVSSVLAQEFIDFELILIDDGSSDSTPSVLQDFAEHDARVVVVTKKNGGPSSARNAGLDRARGKYLIFFDADDDTSPGALAKVIQEMETSGSDLVVSGWQIDLFMGGKLIKNYKQVMPIRAQIDGDKEQLKKYIVRSIGNSGELYNLWNKTFRTDIIREHDLRFREDVHFGEDLIFALHYFRHIRQLNLIPDITYHYQTNSQTSVFSKSALVPEYRRINAEELDQFVGKDHDGEMSDLLGWVKWRWLLSYWRLVCAAKLPRRDKIKLIKQFSGKDLEVAKSKDYISAKKLMIERVASVLRHFPSLVFVVMKLLDIIKKFIVLAKTSYKTLLSLG